MKKVLVIVALASLAACGNNSTTETKVTDSTTVKTDTAMKMDTTVKKVDSTISKIDSTKK